MNQCDNWVARWPLANDASVQSNISLSSIERNISYECRDGRAGAVFRGEDDWIEVVGEGLTYLFDSDFSAAMWLHTTYDSDVVGDLLSRFDPDTRRGVNLTISTHTGVTQTTQSNYRHIHFGIDDARCDAAWLDCGRPGHAVKISALATVGGSLYAGTFENGSDRYGHLWRYDADQHWHDCGPTPNRCNNIGSIANYDGAIYCATGRYNPNGSVLGDPQNPAPGGEVYRVESDGAWINCGRPGVEGAAENDPDRAYGDSDQADETNCLTVYQNQLFATSHHRRGVYIYQGGQDWQDIGPDIRIMSMTIHENCLYVLANGGAVYCYEGDSNWRCCGTPPGSTQTYCAVTHQGRLYVGTWPECEIIRYEGGEAWSKIGRIGYEREVMAAALYNGKCYFGTLPMANVFRMDGDRFTFLGNLDNESKTHLRRVWSMAVHKGQLFAGTLPGGHVRRMKAGSMATHDHAVSPGWHHVAAVRYGEHLQLYLDGALVAENLVSGSDKWNLDSNTPLLIGAGMGHRLNGTLSDVRLYDRALSAAQIQQHISLDAADALLIR